MVAKDWTGQKFHNLTFVQPSEKKYKNGGIIWELKCDCGNTTYQMPRSVVSGRVKACGCMIGMNSRKHDPLITSALTVWRNSYKDCDFELFMKLSQKPCHYCGVSPQRVVNAANFPGWGYNSDYQRKCGNFTFNGLDRVDSTKGHIENNVVPCCWDCNYMKRDKTTEEFLLHIRRIYEFACFQSSSNERR